MLGPTSVMSRHPEDQQGYYKDRYLPKPRTLNNRTTPTDLYYRDRYLPEHQDPTGRVFPSDPAGYNSRTANSNGWRAHRAFDNLKPYEGDDRPDYIDSPELRPMRSLHDPRGSRRQTTPLGDRNTERSVQNTRHPSRSEERAPERHASPVHASRETRRSEGRSFGDSGEGGKDPTTKQAFQRHVR